eukprot:Skav227431  [mRNA]  locus=scaffold203:84582:88816:+ [translate_table: standard]
MLMIPPHGFPNDFLLDCKRDVMIVDDVRNHTWRQPLAILGPHLWLISAPCQSWSSTGKTRGFLDDNGLTLLEALGVAKIHRPKHILLENVKNLRNHRHYPILVMVLSWCGYRIVHEVISELARLTPVHRERFLQLLERVEQPSKGFMPLSFGPYSSVTCNDWDGLFPTSPDDFVTWQPSDAQMKMYANPTLFPRSQEKTFAELRFPNHDSKLPTFLAMYGSQHEIDMSHLQDTGLLGFFLYEDRYTRWFKPMEINLLHIQIGAVAHPKPKQQAWHSVGNMIAPPHALLALCQWIQHAMGGFTQPQFEEVISKLLRTRIRASATCTAEDDQNWYVGSAADIHMLQQRAFTLVAALGEDVTAPQWPTAGYVDPLQGIVSFLSSTSQPEAAATVAPTEYDDVTATCPMTGPGENIPPPETTATTITEVAPQVSSTPAFHDVQVFYPKGCVFTIMVHGSLSWQDVFELWEIEMTVMDHNMHLLSSDHPICPAVISPPDDVDMLLSLQVPCHTQAVMVCTVGPHTLLLPMHTNLSSITKLHPLLDTSLEDPMGTASFDVAFATRLTKPHPIAHVYLIANFTQAMSQVQIESIVPLGTDDLVVSIKGPATSVEHVVTFWFMALPYSWLADHGRTLALQVRNPQHVKVIFGLKQNVFPTPSGLFRDMIVQRLLKVGIQAHHCPDASLQLDIKYRGKVFSTLRVSHQDTFEPLYRIATHALSLLCYGSTPSFVVTGKKWCHDATFQDAINRLPQSTDRIKLVLFHPMAGGGGVTHSEHQKQLLDGLASFFADAGVPQIAINTLFHPMAGGVIFTHSEHQKQLLDGLASFFADAGVPQIAINTKVGVALVNAQDVEQWMSSKPVLPDELGLVIVGHIPPEHVGHMASITVPATNSQGQSVLIAAHLLQLGEKKLTLASADASMVPTRKTTICSVTVWADEFTPDAWKELCQAPEGDTGKPSTAWRVLWCDGSKEVLLPKVLNLPGMAGYVRGLKSHGLRVEAASFDTMWKMIHPDLEPPKPQPKGDMVKLTPLPHGVDRDILQQWALTEGWECWPIKQLGPRTWLVTALKPLPPRILSFNGTPLIIKPVEAHHSSQRTGVIAGPKSQTPVDAKTSHQKQLPQEQWPLQRPAAPSSSQSTASSSGPTSQLLQHQDSKIAVLEQAMNQLRQDVTQTATAHEQRFQTIERTMQDNHHQTAQVLQGLKQDFQTSLTAAMQSQDDKLTNHMKELRELFVRGSKRRVGAKDPNDPEDSDMS